MPSRSGWNPVRRSRKIGTAAQGHGDDNRLIIPESWRDLLDGKSWYERLRDVVAVPRGVAGRDLIFLIEPPQPGWFHPCTLDDVCAVLAEVPPEHLELLDLVVLRQSTRKQRIVRPAWGRAVYLFEVGSWSGSAIVLEAQSLEPIRWDRALGPAGRQELERLRGDGHEIVETPRGFEIRPSPGSLRNTLLYRTLLHELGHRVDSERWTLEEWSRWVPREKEDFAHRYARERMEALRQRGATPFPPRFDRESIERDGMRPDWFRGTVS